MTSHVFAETTHVVAAPRGFVVTYSKLHRNPFRGFGATGVKIWPFPVLWLLTFTILQYTPWCF